MLYIIILWLGFNSTPLLQPDIFFSEFTALDKQLDELNSVLDALEAKNDDIHGKLKELLESSRQERLEIKKDGENTKDRQENVSTSSPSSSQNNSVSQPHRTV